MEDSKVFRFTNSVFFVPFALLFSIWLVYYVEMNFDLNFNKYGILPRELSGLKGIFFSPFVHGDGMHLFNNSIPLVVLSALLYFFYKPMANRVLIIGTLITGLLTWIMGRESYHIGASGVVYLLFSFIFFSGIIRKYFRLIALSLAVIFLYGSMIWFVFPIAQKVSWEGHLSGFLVGWLLAYVYRKIGPQKKEYKFKETEFDLRFDENGNYVPEIDLNSEEISQEND